MGSCGSKSRREDVYAPGPVLVIPQEYYDEPQSFNEPKYHSNRKQNIGEDEKIGEENENASPNTDRTFRRQFSSPKVYHNSPGASFSVRKSRRDSEDSWDSIDKSKKSFEEIGIQIDTDEIAHNINKSRTNSSSISTPKTHEYETPEARQVLRNPFATQSSDTDITNEFDIHPVMQYSRSGNILTVLAVAAEPIVCDENYETAATNTSNNTLNSNNYSAIAVLNAELVATIQAPTSVVSHNGGRIYTFTQQQA